MITKQDRLAVEMVITAITYADDNAQRDEIYGAALDWLRAETPEEEARAWSGVERAARWSKQQ